MKTMKATDIQTKLQIIAEPGRFQIVELLKTGPHSVNEIVRTLQISQPHVSRHLRILSEAGIVQAQKKVQQRIYQLESQPFREFTQWLDSFAQLWDERMDTLDTYLNTIQQPEKRQPDDT